MKSILKLHKKSIFFQLYLDRVFCSEQVRFLSLSGHEHLGQGSKRGFVGNPVGTVIVLWVKLHEFFKQLFDKASPLYSVAKLLFKCQTGQLFGDKDMNK